MLHHTNVRSLRLYRALSDLYERGQIIIKSRRLPELGDIIGDQGQKLDNSKERVLQL